MKKHHKSPNPSSVTTYPIQGFAGRLEPIPADVGREAGYPLDKSPIHRRADI